MRRKSIFLIIFIWTSFSVQAQKNSQWAGDISFGKTAYVGDVGNAMFDRSQPFYGFLNVKTAYKLRSGVWLEGGLSYGSIGYSRPYDEPDFLNKHLQLSGNVQYAPVYYDLYKAFKCTPFLYTGIGFSYYMPVNNRGVEDVNFNIPFGAGVEFSYNHEISLYWRGAFVVNYGDLMDRIEGGANDHFTTNAIGVRYYFSKDKNYTIPLGDIIWNKHGDNYSSIALLDSDGDGVADKYDTCPDLKGPVSNKGCPEITKETYALFDRALRGVQFDFNKSTLKPESHDILDEIAILLLQNQYLHLTINGHTDNIGTDKYNENLSRSRAETVKNYLIEKGINKERLTAKGFGESVPVSSNFTEEGRALNRRVVFQVNY